MATRINLSTNPALKNNTSGNATTWTSSPSGYVRQTGVTGMVRNTGFGGSGAKDVITTPRFAATAGQQYVASVEVKTGGSNTFSLLINWYTSVNGGSFLGNSGTAVPFTINGAGRCAIGPYTAPAGAGAGYLRIIDVDNTTVTFTGLLIEQAAATNFSYFDGDTAASTWSGVAGNSTSYQLTAADPWTFGDSGVQRNVQIGPTGSDRGSWAESGAGVGSGTVTEFVQFYDSAMVASLSYDDHRGRVRVSAFGMPSAVVRALVYRRPSSGGRFEAIRGGQVSITSGGFNRTVDDYEFPEGVDLDYQIVGLASPEGAPDIVLVSAVFTQPAIRPAVWLKFMASPWLNQKLTLTGWGDVGRASNNAAYKVIGRRDPIVITDVHSSRSVQIALRTPDADAGNALDHALSAGQPVFLHTPVDVELPSMYAAIGDYTYTRPAAYSPVRQWTVSLTEVSAPPTSIFGPALTWANLPDIYDSWQEVLDENDTWGDVNT